MINSTRSNKLCRTRLFSTVDSKKLLWLTALTFTALFGITGSVWAQALNSTFETEGNAISQSTPGDDWDSLYYYGSHSLPLSGLNLDLDVYTGVIEDFGATDTTRFGEGTKDIQDIPDWAWQALPPNDKVDITNAQAALYSPGANTFLYMEADRFANGGDASMGLWLLQDSTVHYNADGTWSGQHVAGIPGDTAAIDPRGDLLILAHYTNGGAVDSIAIYEWVGSGGNTDELFGSQGSDAFDLIPKDASTAFGQVNQDTTHAPWPYLAKTGETTVFPSSSFFEGALDLGVLFGNNIPCFTKFLFETRESQSLTAALKDFGLGTFSTVPVVSVNSDTVCTGDSVQLCATLQSGTGIGPFKYDWSNGDTTSCIWVKTSGTYSVVVTGDNGCPSAEASGSVLVVPTPDLTCAGDLLTCDSTLATAKVTVNNLGSLGSVTYLWSPAPVSGQGTNTARYNLSGTKRVVVTTAGGCVDSCEALITEDKTPPDLSCSGDLLTCDSTLATASVIIDNSGELGATITYLWSPAPVSGQGTATARYNTAGNKKVVVTDAATGCKDSCTATITEDKTPPSLSCAGDLLTCDSTLATASVTINNPGDLGATITYLWSPAPVSGQGTATARYNTAGNKKVVVTDVATGCKDSCTSTITEDKTPPDLSCAGDVLTCDSTLATASVTINNPGELGATITYLWSPAPVSGQGTATARYSTAGTKTVVVTDVATGCKDSCQAEITRNGDVPDLTCSGDLLTCDSTLATASVTINNPGDLGTLTYVWSPAPVTGQGTSVARYNLSGTKKVVVTDVATGCKDSCEATITEDKTPPDLSCAGDKLTCDSTLATASVTINNPEELGATITYLWSPAPVSGQGTATARYNLSGTKKVVVTDVETGCKDSCTSTITEDKTPPDLSCAGDKLTCDSTLATASVTINNSGELGATITYLWSPAPVTGQGTATARYSTAGTKKVVVTDVETGCKDSCTSTITEDKTPPDLTCAGDGLTCDSTLATASVTINNSGELGATITYLWSPAPVTGQGTATARYSTAGTKKVVVTDVETGCKDSCESVISQDSKLPDLACSGDLLTCDSALATASVTVSNAGNLGTLTYVWSPLPVSGQGTNTARYNLSGTKRVVVTDLATGCKDSCEATITEDKTPPDLSCSGDKLTCDSTLATASVTINNSEELGATITYLWSPAPVSGQGTATARYNTAGNKKVVVTDVATGCKDSCTSTITEDKTPPDLSCSGDQLSCDSTLATASVTINNSGELGATITYLWSPAPQSGQGTATARYNTSGNKKVVVTDVETGCKDSCTSTITADTANPSCSIAPSDTTVCEGGSVQFCVSGSGGTPPYDFDWSGPGGYKATGACITVSDSGLYTVTVTGANGCTSTCQARLRDQACGTGCTFTQGGWGSKCPKGQLGNPKSTQPGCLRDNYFSQIFPNGVSIGDPSGFMATWTTSLGVENYLPAGGTPKALTQNYPNNPTSTSAGVLGGQVLALTLNVAYSCGGAFFDLGISDVAFCYNTFVIPDYCGKFGGLTVEEFLHIANLVLSGDAGAADGYDAKLSDINFTATCLNELFDNCDPSAPAFSITDLAKAGLILGDVNHDGEVRTSDLIYLSNFVLKAGPAPVPILAVGNVFWDDQVVSTKDVIYLADWLLKQPVLTKQNASGTAGVK